MKYELHPKAELELYEAAWHYEALVPELGLRFADEVERVIQLQWIIQNLVRSWMPNCGTSS